MPKPKKTVLVVVADTHCGSSTGLLPPGNWVGLDGQTWQPSKGQRVLWQQWEECWNRVRTLRKGAKLIIVHNGDAIDGVHHDTTQLVTNDKNEQKRIHLAAMDWALQRVRFGKQDKLLYVYGTASHVGGYEDAIARDLDAVPYIESTAEMNWRDGRYVHHHLKTTINGVRFDIAHHGLSAGARAWTRSNSVILAARSHYWDALEYDTKPADYLIASHFHEFISGSHTGQKGTVTAIITPAFQLKTEYANKVARNKLASIGMLIFVIEADGRHYWECPRLTFDEVKEVEL